jgi:hypothetical protein
MYDATLSHLASHGIVSVVPLFNDLASQPLVQGDFRSQLSQLLSAVAFVGAQGRPGAGPAFGDATSGSWAGRVDASRFALAGHSAGAGVALQGAAEAGRRVAAVATIGAWVNIATTPWLPSLGSAITAPALLLSGEWDEHAPLADNGQLVYDALTSPKLMPIIAGGSHCFLDWTAGSANRSPPLLGLLPWYGYSSCPKAQMDALPPPLGRGGVGMRDQMMLSATHLAAFLRLYMLNDTDAAPLVWGEPMRRNTWMSEVQMAPGAALATPETEVVATTQGVTLTAQLTNLGVAAGNWSITATAVMPVAANATDDAPAAADSGNASLAGKLREQLSPAAPAPAASGLRLQLSDAWLALDADAGAVARQSTSALLPRAPALATMLAAFRRSPPPAPPPQLPRRLLLQLPASTSASGFSVDIDASQAAPGNHTLLLAARSLADGGSTCYAAITVRVPDDVGTAPDSDAATQSVAPLVSALAGAASAQLGRLAAALAALAPPAVSALVGPDGTRTSGVLFDAKAAGVLAAAAASEALAALARAAAALPPQPTPRDTLQSLALYWLQALSDTGALSLSALGGAAGAALSSLRAALLIRVGFGGLLSPPPPPPSPPPASPPPPPTTLSALADLLNRLFRP